ncbi:Fms-interacting protein-domain-containing protein [Protomyces lactucae-debilis]|uniref:Fms-interacting protein-domain-containing protein n=1 Tax=Protomyces lactucae-debilis TaxID=2754530 RepID=A0A1Y2EVE0_PROLT|nr:Fms-interacting protein-domain-containing protein [Protomyces lactucae-debilis]ORY74805.1 Fms-interacting protein-domain-containing protein [Protomyces lactucae-debilis]
MEDAVDVSAALQTLAEQVRTRRIDQDGQEEAYAKVAVLLTLLRRCNRQAHLDARTMKQQTAAHKSRLDQLQLDLQGLYYQQRHLRQAVARCKEAPHSYAEIQCQSDDILFAAQPALAELDQQSREVMEARLRFELETRAALEGERKELGVQKQALMTENRQRRQDLAALERQLDAFVESAETLSQTLQKE